MVDIAVLFGANRITAEEDLKKSLEFEIKLANVSIKNSNRKLALRKYFTYEKKTDFLLEFE